MIGVRWSRRVGLICSDPADGAQALSLDHLWSRSNCSDDQPQPHDPAPLGDLTVTGEAELLEQRVGPGVEVRTPLLGAALDLLGVGLDQAATCGADGIQGARDRGPGDIGPSVALAGEDAAD